MNKPRPSRDFDKRDEYVLRSWPDRQIPTKEIAERSCLSLSGLYTLARKMGLPNRAYCHRPRPE